MQKANQPPAKWRNLAFFPIASLILVADQLTKLWIRFYPEGEVIFDAGFFRIIHTSNTGASFGLFTGYIVVLTIVSLVMVVILLGYALYFYRRFPLYGWFPWISLGLILGGSLGTFVDRLFFGRVTDFIDFRFWPAFNISDSAIVVGVILLIIALLRLTWKRNTQNGESA